MRNYINLNADENIKRTSVSINMSESDGSYALNTKAAEVSERFLRAAALLPVDEFIGVEIAKQVDNRLLCSAFYSDGAEICDDDINWIFKDYGQVEECNSDINEYKREWKTYRLYLSEGKQGDITLAKRDEYIDDMFAMLTNEGAVVQLIAGAAESDPCVHGNIFIRYPGKMSLRLKTLISLSFTHMYIAETEDEIENALPDNCFIDGMTGFLYTAAKDRNNHINEDVNDFDDVIVLEAVIEEDLEVYNEAYYYDSNSIEELGLSLRAFNSLRRAGVETVADLMRMTDEELMHVRNLGRKCMDEVKKKLEEYLKNPEYVNSIPQPSKTCMEMLDELIGLNEVKAQVRKIAAFARMRQDMIENGKDGLQMTLNMEFTGNPGTAKTTVARIMAGIFYETGLLSSTELVEVGRADLVAKYTGQTAEKVKDVFRRAKGKLLFIDEAYSLVEDCSNSFGDEAINTIVQEMEINRNDTLVIFAGYPDQMKKFFDRNPGLRSRVPFTISFKDYSTEEMLRIVELEAETRGFSISQEAMDKVRACCDMAAGNKEAGNGRFCRNMVEKAILEYAERIYGTEITEKADPDFVLQKEDFIMPVFANEVLKPVRRIGFVA